MDINVDSFLMKNVLWARWIMLQINNGILYMKSETLQVLLIEWKIPNILKFFDTDKSSGLLIAYHYALNLL